VTGRVSPRAAGPAWPHPSAGAEPRFVRLPPGSRHPRDRGPLRSSPNPGETRREQRRRTTTPPVPPPLKRVRPSKITHRAPGPRLRPSLPAPRPRPGPAGRRLPIPPGRANPLPGPLPRSQVLRAGHRRSPGPLLPGPPLRPFPRAPSAVAVRRPRRCGRHPHPGPALPPTLGPAHRARRQLHRPGGRSRPRPGRAAHPAGPIALRSRAVRPLRAVRRHPAGRVHLLPSPRAPRPSPAG
jgi:hypothetical protein